MAEPAHVIFLRHGAYHQLAATPSARQPFALTPEGIEQAHAAADRVRALLEKWDLTLAPVAYCSRQLRAWQTARTLLDALGPADAPRLEETSALAERGLGAAANLSVAQIEAVLASDPRYETPPEGWKSDSAYRLPLEGAESLDDAGARVATHLGAHAMPGKATLYIGHGASFRHGCVHLGVLAPEDVPHLSMFHAQPLLLCHDPHGKWLHLDGAWKVRAAREPMTD